MQFSVSKHVLIAGHRGDPKHFPENTMVSFRHGAALGAEMLETDIHLTADGVPVLMHDHTVDRTTDGTGLIREKALAEMQKLNAGSAEVPAAVPTLEEFLAWAAGQPGLLLDLEMKVYLQDEGESRVIESIEKTVALVEKYGLSRRVLFNSFDAFVLEQIADRYGRAYLLHGYYPYAAHMKNIARDPESYLDYACYWAKGEEARAACDYLLSRGIAPCTGSNTAPEDFREAAAYGCAMFTENDVEGAMACKAAL